MTENTKARHRDTVRDVRDTVVDQERIVADSAEGQPAFRPLRIWIPVLLLVGMVAAQYLPTSVDDGPAWLWMIAAFGPLLASLLIVSWWLLLSRASWTERGVGLLGIVASLAATIAFIDPSMLGPALMAITIPLGIAAFAIALIVCSRLLAFKRTLIGVTAAVIGFGFSTLLQAGGMWGDFGMGLDWRWNSTPEERFLASRQVARQETPDLSIGDEAFASPEWPAFRGVNRDGIQHGAMIDSDWENHPPEEMWRILVGPAWSSFAVAGTRLFTQEQRDTMESVVCYDAESGAEIWAQGVESRFSEPLGGPGPRATPTLDGDSLYAMGAEGWLLRLDAKTGSLTWKADLRELAGREPPMWGFSSSPLVTGDVVLVYAGGTGDQGILALNKKDGQLKWSVPASPHSYGSLQTVSVDDQNLLAILTDEGLQLHDSKDGSSVLQYKWQHQGYRALQPQVVGSDGLLIPTGMGSGTRLIRVVANESGFEADEVWTSRALKPDFNDLVVLDGYAYGFDGTIFACLDLADGNRQWKKGRYGKGQVLLLADVGLLLVLSEKGELVLLQANPTEHRELAKFKALEGKTWNHPVVVGDRLYIRNSSEAACYRLPVAHSDNLKQSSATN